MSCASTQHNDAGLGFNPVLLDHAHLPAQKSQQVFKLLLNNFTLKVHFSSLLRSYASLGNFPFSVCFCSGVAVCVTSPLFSCPSLSGVLPHLLFLQNLPSVVVGHVLDPHPSEIILDMCASPGDILLQLHVLAI